MKEKRFINGIRDLSLLNLETTMLCQDSTARLLVFYDSINSCLVSNKYEQ